MAKKTKVQIQAQLAEMELVYNELVDHHAALEESYGFQRRRVDSLQESNGKLWEELRNAKEKVKIFHELLKQEQEQTGLLEGRLLDANKESFAMQEDILVQFGAIKTMVENAETLLLTE